MSDGLDNEETEINLYFSNVVCAFSMSTDIDLKLLAKTCINTYYDSHKGMTRIHLTERRIFASIWGNGKAVCAGAQDNEESYCNAKYLAKLIKNLGFDVKMRRFRIVNVTASCKLPHEINLHSLSLKCPDVNYLPYKHPGALWSMDEFNATLTIFKTGSITIFATSMDCVGQALERYLALTEGLE